MFKNSPQHYHIPIFRKHFAYYYNKYTAPFHLRANLHCRITDSDKRVGKTFYLQISQVRLRVENEPKTTRSFFTKVDCGAGQFRSSKSTNYKSAAKAI